MMLQRLLFLILLFFASIGLSAGAYAHEEALDYSLKVTIDARSSRVHGVASTKLRSGEELVLRTDGLRILKVLLGGRNLAVQPKQGNLRVTAPGNGMLEVTWEGTFTPSRRTGEINAEQQSLISEQAAILIGTWYPRPARLCRYRLTATVPEGFEAVSEADVVEKRRSNGQTVFTFQFPYPVDEIDLIASRYKVITSRFGTTDIVAYFFPEDLGLVGTYVEQTKKYLKLYGDLFGPYPYRRFCIVENMLPTGLSMPTFTLLGQDVVRLPFITETSLGHEVLHQWFGNLVYVDYAQGNWSEGLATYLADHLYEEQKKMGAAYRKSLLIDYQSYVNRENEFPLRQFRGRTDYASKAIGYSKGAMVFHMLKKALGDDLFYRSLRTFIATSRHRRASWDDLEKAFESESTRDLSQFFKQWIDEKGLPDLSIEDATKRQKGGNWEVSAQLLQRGSAYELDVPLTLTWKGGKKTSLFHADRERMRLALSSEKEPLPIILDEEYDVARRLSRPEFPPVIARLLGSDRTLIVPPATGVEQYKEVVDTFARRGALLGESGSLSDTELANASLVLLGVDNPVVKRLFGPLKSEGGFSVFVKEHPLNPARVAAIVNADSQEETHLAFRKIFHYGRYSHVAFKQGKNVMKEVDATENGLLRSLVLEPVLDQTTLSKLHDIIEKASGKKIIYIGETHDRFSHHLVQLEIIKALHRKGCAIAIGMEMFQQPSQAALDAYIAGKIDEPQFLKQSEYFRRWGYDYNLYRPILDYARAEGIPVVALNLQEEIVSKIFRSGLDSLSAEERKRIPSQLDFSDSAYRERLEKIFREHKTVRESAFDFFYQAQVAWDETMAESVDTWLKKHPDYQMVVLAGSGHIEYGSGIPKRAARRNDFGYVTILNDASAEKSGADYVLSPQPVAYEPAPKLMVTLTEESQKVVIQSFPAGSISEKAGMKVGDVIRSIDAASIRTIDDVRLELLMRRKGEKVTIGVLRKDSAGEEKALQFQVVL